MHRAAPVDAEVFEDFAALTTPRRTQQNSEPGSDRTSHTPDWTHEFVMARGPSAVCELQSAFLKLREEVNALSDCLLKDGVLKKEALQARLHRQRFERAQRTHPSASAVNLNEVLGARDLGFSVAHFAGLEASRLVRSTSRTFRAIHDAMDGELRLALSRLVICGGWDAQGQSGRALNTVERLDPVSGSWEVLPPLSRKRGGAVAIAVGASLYVCGGWDDDVALNVVEVFHATQGVWKIGEPMQSRRFSARGGCLEDSVYICGGWDGQEALRSVERLNVAVGRWEEMPPMLKGRARAASAVVGHRLFTAGGWDGKTSLKHAECFDPDSKRWKALPPLQRMVARSSAASVDRLFVVCGGWSGMQALSTVECFDPEEWRWDHLEPMLEMRAGLAAASIGGYLYVCGGWTGEKALSSVERYDPVKRRWEALRQHLSQPLRAAAVTVSVI